MKSEVSAADLAVIAEASIWDREPSWRRGPPEWDVIDRDDLLVWSGPLPATTTNQVVYARWTDASIQRGIAEVMTFFGDRGVMEFEWLVGPTSAPSSLGVALGSSGLVRDDDSHLMTAELPLSAFATDHEVRIIEVTDAPGIREYLRIAHPGWPRERVASELEQRFEYRRLPDKRGGWLVAYLDGEPVANATWKDSADGRCVYLKGAGTRPEFRGRGIYSALTAYRCTRAIERGCRYAAIIAMTDTSAPILRTRGFVDHGPFPRYIYRA